MIKPPAHLEPYVRVLGPDLAVDFLLAFGGADLYIARRPQPGSRLVEVVGQEGAEALAALAATARLQRRVPVGKEWVAKVLAARGLPIAEIARTLHTTDVSVRKYLQEHRPKRPPPDDRQLSLI